MDKGQTASSLHEFGYNRFDLAHSTLGTYNMGIAYPIGYERLEAGEVVENNVDFFGRSTALQDPAFLDASVSIGHYFVPMSSIDPLFEARIKRFADTSQSVELLNTRITAEEVYAALHFTPMDSRSYRPALGSGSLADHLGLSLVSGGDEDDATSNGYISVDLAPFLAYHQIIDEFFTNSHLQDKQYTKTWCIQNIPSKGYQPHIEASVVADSQDFAKDCYFDPAKNQATNPKSRNFFALRYINFEPDYFTTAREAIGGAPAYISVTAGTGVSARSIIQGLLVQKVADMIYSGGYSYTDYYRTIYKVTGLGRAEKDPTFLAGGSGPLQMNAVTNTADDLGAQAGQVIASNPYNNEVTFVAPCAGIYMPIIFIRPKTYYSATSRSELFITDLNNIHKPQFADLPADTILLSEVACKMSTLFSDRGNIGTATIFGFKDRFNERRTRYNRLVGQMRTINSNYSQQRTVGQVRVNSDFLSMHNLLYNPWLLTDLNTDHFQARIYQRLRLTQLLPQTARPYVF